MNLSYSSDGNPRTLAVTRAPVKLTDLPASGVLYATPLTSVTSVHAASDIKAEKQESLSPCMAVGRMSAASRP